MANVHGVKPDESVFELGLAMRTCTRLLCAGITTVGELAEAVDHDTVSRIPYLSNAEYEDILMRLVHYGYREPSYVPMSEYEHVKEENAKLRDLVYSILKCAGEIDRDRGCDVCPMNTDGGLESYLDGTWCKLRPTLGEVGIGVESESES